MEVVDANMDVLWVRLSQENKKALMLEMCYLPPESSTNHGQRVVSKGEC